MTVIFGTLGFTPRKLLPSLTNQPDVEGLVFYHDRHEKSRAAAETVRAYCHDLGLEVEGHEIDAFDVIECAGRMRRDVRRVGPRNIVFNITGGTPVISSAATLVCILEGVRAVYVDERTWHEKSLPLLSMRYEDVLNDEQRNVLRAVAAAGGDGTTQRELARSLDLAASTVSHHVTNLKKKQLVRAEPDPEDGRRERLRILESATLLLEDTA